MTREELENMSNTELTNVVKRCASWKDTQIVWTLGYLDRLWEEKV